MKSRTYYENQFSNYPDVVTKKQLMSMLGGISEKTAQSLLQNGKVKHFRIGLRYKIPKVYVIDYMVSDEYISFEQRMERIHCNRIQDKVERGKQKILLLCEQPQTRKDLMFMLDETSPKTFFRLYLHPLLESGELQMIYPDQRSVSTQRYVRAKK